MSMLGASALVGVFRRFWRHGKKIDHALAETRANDPAVETHSAGALSSAPRAPEFGPILPLADDAEPLVREFGNTIAGVSFDNHDGRSRQQIIRREVKPGMSLVLRLELNNRVDPGAIAALTPGGEQLGYLHADLADQVHRWIECGYGVSAQVVSTGRAGGYESLPIGVGFRITVRGHEKQRCIPGSFKKAVTDAKRAGQLDEAERMLMGEIDAQEEYALRFNGTSIGSWPYEQLAILYRQRKRPRDRLAILRRYCNLPGNRGTDLGLRGHLLKAEAAANKLSVQ
jgi:hypothetical protein